MLWQNATPAKKGAQAQHKRNKPKPFIPDFMQKKAEQSPINKGSQARSVDDIKSILDLPRG